MSSTDERSLGAVLQWAIGRTEGRAELADLNALLVQAETRLNEPMRVAIVGLIKAGKSTFLNALLGREVAATGPVETTFNVTWLRRGTPERIEAVFKDGSPRQSFPIEELEGLASRLGDRQDILRRIAHLEVFLDEPSLSSIEWIDTPGLSSTHADDAQNTLDFLRLHGEELSQTTESYASQADAVLYLFSKGVHEQDTGVLKELEKANANPFTAIGVLTKADGYWDPREPQAPLERAKSVCDRLRSDSKLRSMFHAILPVGGLIGAGAGSLSEADFQVIAALAAAPQSEVERMLRSAQRVADPETLPEIDPSARASILHRLGLYGLALAIESARKGLAEEQMRGELLAASGIEPIVRLARQHFGARASTIRARSVLGYAELCWQDLRPRLPAGSEGQKIGDETLGRLERFVQQELRQSLAEIELLRALYENEFEIGAEERVEILRAFGEEGRTCAERLGVPEGLSLEDQAALARRKAGDWRIRAERLRLTEPAYSRLCLQLARTFDRIASRVESAIRLLVL